MIYISYGITKSGSTLAFELTRELLARYGHDQSKLAAGVMPDSHINFLQNLRSEALKELVETNPRSHLVVAKTHARSTPFVARLLESGRIKAQAVFRDPRDILLSLIDAGARARKLEEGNGGRKQSFSEITDLDSAMDALDHQLIWFDEWASLPNVLQVDYQTVAFRSERFLREVKRQLRLGGAPDFADIRRQVTANAFTQLNKGVRVRYRDEMPREQQRAVLKRFAWFYAKYRPPNAVERLLGIAPRPSRAPGRADEAPEAEPPAQALDETMRRSAGRS